MKNMNLNLLALKKAARWLSVTGLLSVGMISSISAQPILFKNATVHTSTAKGTLKNTDVLIEKNQILQVAQNIAVGPTVKVVDAKGKHITPGLINAATQLGLVEISAVENTVDSSTGLDNMGASFSISHAINYRSTLIPQNRIQGLTRAIVVPSNGGRLFAGQGTAIRLNDQLDGLVKENIGQFVAYGEHGAGIAGGSRAAAFQLIDKALSEAKYLRRNENRYLEGFEWSFSQSLADLKALYPVLDKKVPLIVSANRADDIKRLIDLADRHQIRLVVRGGGEAWLVAKALANAKVPVIIDPIQNLPSFESLSIRLDGAARLYSAGVKLLFTGGGSHNGYLVRQSAGNAVANGLPADAALEAMTINTAEVFGIVNYGQVKAGMEADIVLWDGDPLELTSSPDLVLIQGESIPLVSRATRLRDRYWDLKGNHQQAFTH